MKKIIYVFLPVLFFCTDIIAQDLILVRKSGLSEAIKLMDIDSIYFTESQPPVYGSIMDIDSNVYRTVSIGAQTWMADNLKTNRYRNGDTIPTTSNPYTDIANEDKPVYYWAYEGDSANAAVYGYLYTWYVANDSNVCPSGWHVSTDVDWTALTTYLGGQDFAGGDLKEAGFIHWADPNTGADNSTGFSALPGGGRLANGVFVLIGLDGGWWTSTEESEINGLPRGIGYDTEYVNRAGFDKKLGFSIRCVKD